MSYKPSNILKAWTLLVRDNDPTATAAAESIRQLAADELMHAWLEGWIAPVGQALPQAKPVEFKPVEFKPVEFKPVQPEEKSEQVKKQRSLPAPKKIIPRDTKPLKPGKQIPGLTVKPAYKSVSVMINGLKAKELLMDMGRNHKPRVSATRILTAAGFKNGLGSMRSAVESKKVSTVWGQWLVDLLGPSILIKKETPST